MLDETGEKRNQIKLHPNPVPALDPAVPERPGARARRRGFSRRALEIISQGLGISGLCELLKTY